MDLKKPTPIVINRRLANKQIDDEFLFARNNNLPMEINIDTIRQMKLIDPMAAQDMIYAFRKDVLKAKAQEDKNFDKIERLRREVIGLCSVHNCMNMRKEGYKSCQEHITYKREYRKMRKKRCQTTKLN